MSVRPARVDFYFDYVSGYAYFGWWEVKRACAGRGVELRPRPVLFARLLERWGQSGPAEVPPKTDWVFRDWLRRARIGGIPYAPPPSHPFDPLLALRLSLHDVGGERQTEVIDALFRAGWAQRVDLADEEAVERVLEAAGLDARNLLAQARDPVVKEALRSETEAAIERGVFGVPTTIAGRTLLFGSDRLDHLELVLDGRDPLDEAIR